MKTPDQRELPGVDPDPNSVLCAGCLRSHRVDMKLPVRDWPSCPHCGTTTAECWTVPIGSRA